MAAPSSFTFQKRHLSASIDGQPIHITGSASGSATKIHTAVAGTVNMDEVWLYANNTHTAEIVLTLCWGDAGTGSGATGDGGIEAQLKTALSASAGSYLVAPGLLLNNGHTLHAFAATADKVNVIGYVNRISSSLT